LQDDVKRLAGRLFSTATGPEERLLDVFDHAEIQRRHLCVPIDWLGERHPRKERSIYRACDRLVRCRAAIERAGLRLAM
jgi:alkylresorcinol/alkylpyrone synthase